MISLAAFGDLSSVDVGAFAPKPTSLTEDQQEAAVSLWTAPDGATDIGV